MRTKDFEFTRLKGNSRVLPVTVRTLESLIRLATAHAKIRLGSEVTLEDCAGAVRLINFTLFEEDPQQKMDFEVMHSQSKKMDAEEKRPSALEPNSVKVSAVLTKKQIKTEPIVPRLEEVINEEPSIEEQFKRQLTLDVPVAITQEGRSQKSLLLASMDATSKKNLQKIVFKAVQELATRNEKERMNYITYEQLREEVGSQISDPDMFEAVVLSLDSESKLAFDSANRHIFKV